MPLDISNVLRVSPESLPAQGGAVRATFEASAVGAPSRLRAEYRLGPAGIPYRLTGATQLPASEAGLDPRDYRMELTLQATGDTGDIRNVQIIADVFEVGGTDQGTARGRVAIQRAAPETAAAAPESAPAEGGDLAGRMRGFRSAQGLTQSQVAERLGTSRSTISRIERGHVPSDEILSRLEEMGIDARD
jgi:DNA-binding XRE family transcriptional regulator